MRFCVKTYIFLGNKPIEKLYYVIEFVYLCTQN